MKNYYIQLKPGHIYVLHTRATGNEKLFLEDENYRYFLEKLFRYILPIADICCYCLLPNKIQIIVKIKSRSVIQEYFSYFKNGKSFTMLSSSDFIMERFSNLLNCYAKSFNKMYNRYGSLFVDYLRREEIQNINELKTNIYNIHSLPLDHGYCNHHHQWPWTSYHDFLNPNKVNKCKLRIVEQFGGIDTFVEFHMNKVGRIEIVNTY